MPVQLIPRVPRFNQQILKQDEHDNSAEDQPKDRIFKGYELTPHEFPWMVKIKV